jgi:beta-glucanase (GH16 family)
MTFGKGYWPAFWLLNAYYVDDKPEIDIMEFIGDDQDVVYHTYHYYDAEGNLRSTKSQPTPGIDFTGDFHTYGVEWKPGTIVFYVDGIERHRISDPKVSQQDMYIIANTAIGGWWPGSPDETTPFPGEYTIDYIRAYQKTTPFEDFPFFDFTTAVPFADDVPGVSPNHRPPIELWPEGYPEGT